MSIDETVRPWGRYDVAVEDADFKVKTITVNPGKRLSYQKHARRAEHWFVVRGSGTATVDGRTLDVHQGRSVDVPTGSAHRMENTGEGDLVFVEVQIGDYFGEDDIVRLEDDFGRGG